MVETSPRPVGWEDTDGQCGFATEPGWEGVRTSVNNRAPTVNDSAIGRRIRTYRVAKGMPMSELSSRVGVSNPQLHRYERGITRVAASRLIAIAEALNVSVETLVRGEGTPAALEGQTGTNSLASEAYALTQAFNSIRRPELRFALIALAQSMAKYDTKNQS